MPRLPENVYVTGVAEAAEVVPSMSANTKDTAERVAQKEKRFGPNREDRRCEEGGSRSVYMVFIVCPCPIADRNGYA